MAMIDFEEDSGRGAQVVTFYDEEYKNEEQTAIKGFPVYELRTFVKIFTPGNPREIPVFLAGEEYQKRYPKEWNRYLKMKAGETVDEDESGYPLSEWSMMDRAMVATMRDLGIRTLEQFVEIADDNLKNMGSGFLTLKYRGKRFLDAMKTDAPVNKLAERVKRLEEELSRKDDTIKTLEMKINSTSEDMPSEKMPISVDVVKKSKLPPAPNKG